MSLSIKLKSGERLAVGGSFLSFAKSGTDYVVRIEGDLRFIKEKDLIEIGENPSLIAEYCHYLQTICLLGVDDASMKKLRAVENEIIAREVRLPDKFEQAKQAALRGDWFKAFRMARSACAETMV